ncbi:ribokinase [Gorillibacterium sp. sgz5001074]|uniref:ribokinase n=1 Tax=Gorillibacterium sp. sgz5001074 TaxID=3446695 RepID=UPI003F6650F1
MTPNIVVVGSLNMDIVVTMDRMPHKGETVHGRAVHYVPGGKGANQAAAAARLGAAVTMIGAVGDDAFGGRLTSGLQAFGVDTSYVRVMDGMETGTAHILHTAEDNCIVVVPGANGRLSPEDIRRCSGIISRADVLITQLEVPLETVREALRLAREAGVRTILNPAPAVRLPEELLKLVDVLTPNETEFAFLSGRPVAESEEALREDLAAWQDRYGGRVVVTRGPAGSSYLEEGELRTASSLQVEVADTTGAGDAFNGALGFCLASGKSFGEAAVFACRAGSLSVTKFGAQGGLPSLTEVRATYD